ncbi:MAG TPA: CaiB/BaiF CoA-transferase family protein [Bryobacteraceae bacterium]|nr:CaiB/BaiF CoA-transferase family protein [Bryobacteraceae bacterium]
MSESKGILSGLRVIDCGTYIAAPAAAVILSDFGAEVIKIERPPHGDPYRYLSLVPGMPVSPTYYCWTLTGRNKKSVALDLGDATAREVLLKLVAAADVFITNYQRPLIQKFRLSYEDLAPLNERLIYAYLTGYGLTGEEVDKPGYDITAYWARSGLMNTMHNGDAEPTQSPAGFGDHPTSMTMFAGIMLGLYRRAVTGKGLNVSTSLMANGAWAHACGLQAALIGAQFLPKRTRATTVNPIVNHYVTRDKQRFLTCCLDPMKDWPNLCRALAHEELIHDPRFATPELRSANGPELVAIIDAAVAAKDMAEWKEIFLRHDVIWGPVPSTQQAASDPQMEANGVFAEIEPGLRTVSNPLTVAGVEKEKPRMAPAVGEHTVEVLQTLGYSKDAIGDLLSRGAAMDGKPKKTSP